MIRRKKRSSNLTFFDFVPFFALIGEGKEWQLCAAHARELLHTLFEKRSAPVVLRAISGVEVKFSDLVFLLASHLCPPK